MIPFVTSQEADSFPDGPAAGPIRERHRGEPMLRFFRALLVVGLFAGLSLTHAGEITTEAEDASPIKDADVVSVDAKNVVYKVGNKQFTKAVTDVRKIDFRDVDRIPSDKAFSRVDLTDGTALLVSEWTVKGRDLEMTLLSGPKVKIALSVVNGILNKAKEDKDRTDWGNRVINTRGKEALVLKVPVTRINPKTKKEEIVKDENDRPLMQVMNLPAKIGDGDEKGETIELGVDTGDGFVKQKRKQTDLHGLIFAHNLDTKAPAAVCKLVDTFGNAIIVSKIRGAKNGLTVETPSGAKLEFTLAQIAQLDFTKGRLDYLSALDPTATTITLNSFDAQDKVEKNYKWFVYKDSNLHLSPIKLGGTAYRHGLTLLPDVELEYNLNGNYREFAAVVGVDDETKAVGEVTLEIYADNKKIETVTITLRPEKGKNGEIVPAAKAVKKLQLNVKNVTKLQVILKAKDELSGLSIGVSLGDARVTR